jgi:hypothetical protein
VPTRQVVRSGFGVQQTSGFGRVSQTWPEAQQTPSQQTLPLPH